MIKISGCSYAKQSDEDKYNDYAYVNDKLVETVFIYEDDVFVKDKDYNNYKEYLEKVTKHLNKTFKTKKRTKQMEGQLELYKKAVTKRKIYSMNVVYNNRDFELYFNTKESRDDYAYKIATGRENL